MAVVLGPVLLGSVFVGTTVAAVSHDRTADRLDHAATTVRTAIGAVCRQLQATADALATLPEDERARASERMVSRGLVSEVAAGADPEWRDCAGVGGGGAVGLSATSDDVVVVQAVDAGFVDRLAASSGADVVLLAPDRAGMSGSGETGESGTTAGEVTQRAVAGGGVEQPGRAERHVPVGPGQPLPLMVSVPVDSPAGLYALLAAGVVAAGGVALLVARWLARSTTRPLEDLAVAAGRVAVGELDTRVPVAREDEIGQLATTFNRMTRELQAYVQALTVSRDQLRGHLSILGDTLSSTHDLHRILQVLLQTALAATGARAGAVLLLDHSDDRLVARYSEGLDGRWDLSGAELSIPVGEGVLGAVAATGQPQRGVTEAAGESRRGARTAERGLRGGGRAVEDGSRGSGRAAEGGLRGGGRAAEGGLRGGGKAAEGGSRGGESAAKSGSRRGGGGAAGESQRGVPQAGDGASRSVAAGEPDCRSYVAVPICAPPDEDDGLPQTLGVLALYDRLGGQEFDDTDLTTLRTFAGQAGVAVHNVRVHEEAQRLSLTDPLTGLWNYRYLRESLRREVERANRFGRTLTVLVLDLDHFKEVNDTYGHAAGDAVLQEFARRVRVGLREVDLAFRHGGEEFVVLLPETDAYGGVIVAERLGAAVRDQLVPIDNRRVDAATGQLVDRIAITVSVGVAVYPEHGVTAQQVLDAADDALYAAKNAGRDTYRLAEAVLPGVTATQRARKAPATEETRRAPEEAGGRQADRRPPGVAKPLDGQFDQARNAPGGPNGGPSGESTSGTVGEPNGGPVGKQVGGPVGRQIGGSIGGPKPPRQGRGR